jgi:hypothetical protein
MLGSLDGDALRLLQRMLYPYCRWAIGRLGGWAVGRLGGKRLGFRVTVQGLAFRVWQLAFRFQGNGLAYGVCKLGSEIGFRMQGLRFRLQSALGFGV